MPVNPKLCYIILIGFFSILSYNSSFGQVDDGYDEIALFLDVPKIGGRDMDVLIKGNEVYLPITDLFDFLMIRNVPSPGLDSITGFFINQDATYLIDRLNQQILYNGELFELNPGDLIRTETNLYLRGLYFGQIFGLECKFNFRTMSVRVNTRLELPAIREMRLQAMRKNIKRLAGEEEADTNIGRRYPMFRFGMADWSVNVSEQLDGQVDSRLGLALGSMIAGGEATVALNYNSYAPFTEKQQHYLWRYVNNDNKAVRQVMAGKYATGATSSIYDPVVGAKITNASTQFRRSFGSYTLSDHTEPNWIVELYVNNVLVDYTTADASGFFTFEVPLVYGNTNVMLKFYGPYGEERTREQNITIPFNFIPKKTLEYSVSAGMVEDNENSIFSRSHVYYGLTRSITIGSGVEYLSSVSSGPFMPFVNGSFRLASNLLLSGEFSPEVRSKGTLTYRLPSSLQFDINYIYYNKDQKAINNIFREERKISVSMPIRLKNFSVYNRFSVNQLVLPSTNYTTSEWLISGALFGISTNITTYGVFVGNTEPYFYTDFSMSFRLPKDITLQPRAQYSYTNAEFLSAKLLAEKRVFKKGYFTASYEQNFRSNMHLLEFGLRYDFNFAQTSVNLRQTDRSTKFIHFARGSIVNDGKNDYVYTDYRSNVGRGAISIIPFLDKNGNGTRDPGEPKVYGLNLRANGGRIEKREADTTIRIFGLEPYTDCFIEFDQSSLDNIAWRLKHRSMNIAVDPNIVKLIEIPIEVVGEAAGMVWIDHNGTLRGLGRIIVNIYDKNQKIVGRTLSEADGYFTYFGLKPGTYDARIDSSQLRKLQMTSSPGFVDFTIAANIDGDYVDGLDFIIKVDTTKPIEGPKTIDMIVHEEIAEDWINSRDSYSIEITFDNETEADSLRDQITTHLNKEAVLIPENDLYKLRISGFETKGEVEESYPILQRKGINEIGLIINTAMLQTRLLTIIPGVESDTVISLVANDTVLLVVHKIDYEDTTSFADHFTLEIGTFDNEVEASAIRNQISTMVSNEVILVPDNDLYKVRIAGLATSAEVEDAYLTLQSKGISEIGLITHKGLLDTRILAIVPGTETDTVISLVNNDTSVMVVHKQVEEVTTAPMDSYDIEIEAFETAAEAEAMRDQLSTMLGREVSIIPEEGLYKLRIAGLMTIAAVVESYPVLQSKGISEINLVTHKGSIELRLLSILPGAETDTVISLVDNDTTLLVVHKQVEKVTTAPMDSYDIEIEAYETVAEAEAMRDQLSTMLGKEVDLIPEDGQYTLRITHIMTNAALVESYLLLQTKGISEIDLIINQGMIDSDLTTHVPAIETDPAKELAEEDSGVVVIHNIVEEDSTSFTDSYAIQLGAFKYKDNAYRLRKKLMDMLDKEVIITVEDDYYKVRLVGFNSNYEVERYIPVLVKQGVREIWVITLIGTRKPDLVAGEPDIHRDVLNTFTERDTTYYVIHDVFEEVLTTGPDSYTIQLGAFNRKINADALRAKLATILGKEVEIFVEDELYKVRIIGFETLYEAEKYVPELQKEDVSEINILPLKGRQNYRTAISILDTITGAKEKVTQTDDRPPATKETTSIKIQETNADTVIISKPAHQTVKKEEPATIIPPIERATEKTEVEEKTARVEDVESKPDVERRKTLEERLLEAEYRSGLYESRWPGVEFTIQVAASKTIGDPEVIKRKFDLSGEVEVEKVDEWYRFTTGHFIKYWKAREYRNILNTRNELKDAFIVAYKDGKKVMLYDLLAMVEPVTSDDTGTNVRAALPKGFSVQILATKDGSITDSEIRKKYDIDEDIFKEYSESDGLYRYTIGNFNTYIAAVKVRNKIRAKGFRDAFVVGYKDGKRVKDLNSIF
ncbi:MAG: SPOR domain-containing protein [Bacteroidetes bacterium]|nr:SPOR domain-containing protein [Bacteroidota bacterium]